MKLTTHYSRPSFNNERLRTLGTDYFNNLRPMHDAASDDQITWKMDWQEQKKWILHTAEETPTNKKITHFKQYLDKKYQPNRKTKSLHALLGPLSMGVFPSGLFPTNYSRGKFSHLRHLPKRRFPNGHFYHWDSSQSRIFPMDFFPISKHESVSQQFM